MIESPVDSSPNRVVGGSALAALIVLFVSILVVAGPVNAKKKFEQKPMKGQAGQTFANTSGQTAHGLKVQLSTKAEVVTDGDTNRAGPFRNVEGNGTTSLELSNPVTPIAPDSEPFDLVFRSYKSGLKVTKYWWLDDKGKQIGKKQSP